MMKTAGDFFLTGICVMCIASCAPDVPAVVEAAPKTEAVVPQSKPLKIPVGTVEKGKSSGMGMDDFFVLQQSGGALVYDVRDPYFFQKDHIPGAINWPGKKYDEEVQARDIEIQQALKDGKKVVLYCFNLGCPEARNVAKKLTRRGYNVFVLTMGIDSWRDTGLPME